MYLRRNLPAYRRTKLDPTNTEAVCLDIGVNNNSRSLLCAAYRSPGRCKPTDFIESFSSSIKTMYKVRNELILIENFNVEMTEDSSIERAADQRLTEFCERFCLRNQITEATRVTNTSKTLIDVILASHPDRFATSGNLHLGLSDHDLIFTVCKYKLSR